MTLKSSISGDKNQLDKQVYRFQAFVFRKNASEQDKQNSIESISKAFSTKLPNGELPQKTRVKWANRDADEFETKKSATSIYRVITRRLITETAVYIAQYQEREDPSPKAMEWFFQSLELSPIVEP